MTRSRSTQWPAAVFTALCAAGCVGSANVDPGWFSHSRELHGSSDSTEFPGAASILTGFDAPGSSERFMPGDRVLFGLELETADDVRRWLLLVEVEDTNSTDARGTPRQLQQSFTATVEGSATPTQLVIDSPVALFAVTSFEPTGEVIARTNVEVPRESLSYGVTETCAMLVDAASRDGSASPYGAEFPTAAQLDVVFKTIFSLTALFRIVERNELLAEILWQVVEKPSILSVVFGGVSITQNFKLDESEAAFGVEPAVAWGAAAFRFPVEFTVNEQLSLLASVVVTEPHSPLNLGAGLVSLVAMRPGDEHTRFTMQALAARRGR